MTPSEEIRRRAGLKIWLPLALFALWQGAFPPGMIRLAVKLSPYNPEAKALDLLRIHFGLRDGILGAKKWYETNCPGLLRRQRPKPRGPTVKPYKKGLT